jgi:magnesium transporter
MAGIGSIVCEFDLVEHSFRELSLDDFKVDFEQSQKIYWVHCDLSHPEDLKTLASKLPDHIIEWCTHMDKSPKFVEDDVSLSLQVECPLNSEKSFNLATELDFESFIIHLTAHFCFTAATEPIPAISFFRNRYPKGINYAKTSCFILFLLLDSVINDYARLLLEFQSISDQFDLKVREKHENIYSEILGVKKQAMKSKHYISAIRDMLMRMSARKILVISKNCRMSLKNLLNHSQLLFIQFDSIRDTLNSTLNQIDNTLMQELNKTMRILTAFAAILMPLSLITGIYGMNFSIPQFQWKHGYQLALGSILLCGIIIFWIFKKKRLF